ncbi:ExeM/NucH family extracellular endonuclease [Phycicoccus sonneratiae]|uniref:ExeM/NucH family extracellular endonuclease n=1 Tax=Phycicoccus sonneratiae TaxID=2807628 RepID=A0ABS2CMV0_9MICO|nr:ExeM/NucH family extracellular endonuclease [Phycicoccus sonneraticus]MBM6401191.1 ExeM/NucH family extracellular endonuclease [Phycicoccus sonneraticus]
MNRMPLRRLVVRVAVGALALAAPVALTPTPASAAATDLFFSEYVEGSSSNKAIEIYNGTGTSVDLAAGAYTLALYSNGSATPSRSVALSGTIAAGDVFVAANPSADASITDVADLEDGNVVNWNGDDAIALAKDGVLLDVFGQIGTDPGTQWGSGSTSTLDHTLRRLDTVCAGDPDGSDAFDPSVQWAGFANNTTDGLGSHSASCGGPVVDDSPAVASTSPADGATATPAQSPTVTFTEPVALADGALTLACGGADVPVAVTGGPSTWTVDPEADLAAGASCTLTVHADAVTDVDEVDPPDAMTDDVSTTFTVATQCGADFTSASAIQGTTDTSPLSGQTVTTQGVVVADYEGAAPALRGYYLQDLEGDGDPATSDAVFVFDNGRNEVRRGDVVRVTGQVSEFQGQTQVSSSAVEVCGTGSVEPTEVELPMADAAAYERYEGMLVAFPQTLSVTEHFQLGRFGLVVVSSGGRLRQPTSVAAPGPEAAALRAANTLNRLIIDDTLQNQNPDPIIWGRGGAPLSAENTLRGGDTVTGATGVMTYTWAGNAASGNAYRLRPVDQSGTGIRFEAANPRPTSAPDVGGDVQVVGMNLLNYFNTFTGCAAGTAGAALDCRGANSAAEFERQAAKTVAAMTALDADVFGVNEIENDGYGDTSALADLVGRLNAATAPGTYAYLDVDARTGGTDVLGSDAIKVAMVYKPSVVTPVGDTAVLNTPEFVNGGDAAPRARPSLAQAWKVNATGGVFVVDVNHLKSKGSACEVPDAGDGQGNCNVVRTNSVKALLQWLGTDPTGTGDDDVLLVGDYNSYAKEDPIRTLEEGGFTNLVEKYQGEDAYSYAFDGQWGYLDHALGSPSLVGQVTGVADYHINADEPSVLDYNTEFKSAGQVDSLYAPDQYRVSDHDPVKVGLSPDGPPRVVAGFVDGSVRCGRDNAQLRVTVTDPGDTATVRVAWGDGTTSTVEGVTGERTIGHTYATAGKHTATVTVTDSRGNVVTTTADVVVEYRLDTVPTAGSTLTLPRGVPVPVLATVRQCDGRFVSTTAPVATLTRGGTEVARTSLTAVGPLWIGALRTSGIAKGTYALTVTLPETGQTATSTLRLR